ncbi:hypothetical protein AB0O91_28340 [Kitasatospora sp. NPDC089797]|uniref:hypothetical protein n=1 Tax=Kitasatospora sp. NPDC089797 TaxID=3155298 RepID=UPI00343A926B
MTNHAGRIHKMLGILALLLVSFIGFQSQSGHHLTAALGGPSVVHAVHGDDSGWGP